LVNLRGPGASDVAEGHATRQLALRVLEVIGGANLVAGLFAEELSHRGDHGRRELARGRPVELAALDEDDAGPAGGLELLEDELAELRPYGGRAGEAGLIVSRHDGYIAGGDPLEHCLIAGPGALTAGDVEVREDFDLVACGHEWQ